MDKSVTLTQALAAYASGDADADILEHSWVSSGWGDAVSVLDEAWRSGQLPGVLFHGTGMRHAESIERFGLRPTDASVFFPGNKRMRRIDTKAIHLGTPLVAGWYAKDSFVGSEDQPILVAIDFAGFIERGAVPDHLGKVTARYDFPRNSVLGEVSLLPDANAVDSPAVSVTALGAPDDDSVMAVWHEGPKDWRSCLQVFGALAVRSDFNILPSHIKVMRSAEEVAAFSGKVSSFVSASDTLMAGELQKIACKISPWPKPDDSNRTLFF